MAIRPRISYVAEKSPLKHIPIVRKKISKTDYINWKNRLELVTFIDSIFQHPNSDTYLYIKCNCNKEYVYSSKSDVPFGDIICSCGRIVLKYDNQFYKEFINKYTLKSY